MNFATLKLFVLVLILQFASTAIGQTVGNSGWNKINANNLFSFRLPQGFEKTKTAGVENYLGEYYKGTTRFFFVCNDTDSYDVKSDSSVKNYQVTKTQISGKPADIRTFSFVRSGKRVYRAELNFGDWENGDYELYMQLESENQADVETAKQIFGSVVFAQRQATNNK